MKDAALSYVVVTDQYRTIRRVVDCLRAQTARRELEVVIVAPRGAGVDLGQAVGPQDGGQLLALVLIDLAAKGIGAEFWNCHRDAILPPSRGLLEAAQLRFKPRIATFLSGASSQKLKHVIIVIRRFRLV